jgi:hypothetical protein
MKLAKTGSSKNNADVLFFLGRVLLWMPVSFALWYFVVPGILLLTATIVDWILTTFAGHAIEAIKPNGRTIQVLSQFEGYNFNIQAMSYAYSFPFFLALVLASPDTILGKIKKYAVAIIPLFLIVIWGVGFDAISVLAFRSSTEVAQQLNTTPTIRLILSLGYQMGKLIIPPLVPVVLWLYLYRDYAHKLVPKLVK